MTLMYATALHDPFIRRIDDGFQFLIRHYTLG